jgi:hypothetical protein
LLLKQLESFKRSYEALSEVLVGLARDTMHP